MTVILGLTVFTTGAAILALELLASRMMVPAFGTSLHVWGAVLSITLLALAGGYVYGGRVAARIAMPTRRLTAYMIASAGWIALLPTLAPKTLSLAVDLGLYGGPILASAVILALPLVLLATAVPLALGQAASGHDGKEAARTAGNLFALSTLGSVLGALVTAYGAVPLIGVRRSLLATAIVLVVCALPGLWRGAGKRAAPGVLLLVGLNMLSPICGEPARLSPGVDVLAHSDTLYGRVTVVEDRRNRSRVMLIDGATMAWAGGPDFRQPRFPYVARTMDIIERYQPTGRRALVLGLGGGTIIGELASAGYQVDAVEIDPVVAELAERYFGFRPTEATVHLQDGRWFLQQAADAGKRWDVVVLDVSGKSPPAHLHTREAYQLARRVMADQGLVILNTVALLAAPDDRIVRHTIATMARVFPAIEPIATAELADDELINVLVVGSVAGPAVPFEHADDRWLMPIDRGLPALTDDWNPAPSWSGSSAAMWRRTVTEWLGDGILYHL